jgi:EEF1A lysine methyltransferase 4
MPIAYGNPSYWEERYSQDTTASFDWYLQYVDLKPYLLPLLKKDDEILCLGCGNSPMMSLLYADGYTNISNLDISMIVISTQAKRYKHLIEMDWMTGDVTNMESLPDGAFDVIFEKALLDSLLCGTDANRRTQLMMKEINRVLKPGGTYVCVSFGNPPSRLPYLLNNNTQMKITVAEIISPTLPGFKLDENSDKVNESMTYYMYVCKKPL